MTDTGEKVTPIEQMIVSAARLITEGSVLMVGTQWPIIVSLFAKSLHAPGVTICYEGGVILHKVPDRIPLFTADPVLNSSSALLGSSFDTLGMILHGGRADMALLSAASVDRYGNINTTCIGDYRSPKIRFGGSGGACDFGCLAPKTVIILEHDRRRFPEQVDFITTPGYLKGKVDRVKTGLRPNTGPYAVITTLGLFHFDEQGEMVLKAHNPDVSIQEVKAGVQWELKLHKDVGPLDPPSEKEFRVLREKVDPDGMYLRDARRLSENGYFAQSPRQAQI
ncbi:MAG: CoA-transferase subunit beta [Deltaproteobacteria bacterium]|nr:CoA-transferase subunit beta [Deltaproteobacteria bacterium]